jgi:hypothetical protein
MENISINIARRENLKKNFVLTPEGFFKRHSSCPDSHI